MSTSSPNADSIRPARRPRVRGTAEQRRADVLAAARHEFAERGYHAASTAAIAKRAGISQPYIYALFPDKRELFLASYREVTEHIKATFRAAAVGDDVAARLASMGRAYRGLVASRDVLRCQFQAIAAAESDPELRALVRAEFVSVLEEVERCSGAAPDEVGRFTAVGMMLGIAAILELPDAYLPVAPVV